LQVAELQKGFAAWEELTNIAMWSLVHPFFTLWIKQSWTFQVDTLKRRTTEDMMDIPESLNEL